MPRKQAITEGELTMTTFHGLPISLIVGIAIHPQAASPGLAPSETPVPFSVSVAMRKDHLSVGEKPEAVVVMTNPDVVIAKIPCGNTVQVHVQGKNGEPPLTEWSHLYGVPLPGGGLSLSGTTTLCVPRILQPGPDIYRIYDLSRFYNLGEPGKYTVFFEVQDPSAISTTPVLLRTNTAQFEVQAREKPGKTLSGAK